MASKNWLNIGSSNAFSSIRRRAIAWTNADIFFIGHSGTNLSEIQKKT